LLFASGCGVTAINAASPPQVSTATPAPSFALSAQDGQIIDLAQLTAASNVALVFYRGHW
jgi:peroxiredoxin